MAYTDDVSGHLQECSLGRWSLQVEEKERESRHDPEYTLIYVDLMYEYEKLKIDWNGLPSEIIYFEIAVNHWTFFVVK